MTAKTVERTVMTLLFAVFIVISSAGRAAHVQAADWIDVRSRVPNMTSVKLTWPDKKNIVRWKIRRAVRDKDGNPGSYKTVKTLGKGKKSYLDKGLKKNTSYVYEVRGYRKKGKKYIEACYSEIYEYTGLEQVNWEDYAHADAYCSPVRIDLSMYAPGQGLAVKGYQVYRRKSGDSGYKKIATIRKKNPGIYKDKKVEKGVTYTYRFRSFTSYNNKTIYSPWSEVLTRSAVNQKASFTSQLIDRNESEIVIRLESKKYNGNLILEAAKHEFRVGGDGYVDDEDESDESEWPGLSLIGWSKDGVTWTKPRNRKDSVTLGGGKTLYLRFGDSKVDLRLARTLYDEALTYNRLPSVFRLSLDGEGVAAMNGEYIH